MTASVWRGELLRPSGRFPSINQGQRRRGVSFLGLMPSIVVVEGSNSRAIAEGGGGMAEIYQGRDHPCSICQRETTSFDGMGKNECLRAAREIESRSEEQNAGKPRGKSLTEELRFIRTRCFLRFRSTTFESQPFKA